MTPLQKSLQDGMTVKELIETLEDMDKDAKVVFAYNSRDHWRTQVAAPVQTADEGYVTYSDYHQMPKVDEGEDMTRQDTLGTEMVVILNLGYTHP